jgi:hypothetical protein
LPALYAAYQLTGLRLNALAPAQKLTRTPLWVAHASPVSFLWPSTFGLVTTLLVGYGACLVRPASDTEPALTWRGVMKQAEVISRE